MKKYCDKFGNEFYIEPAFYTQLENLKPLYPDRFNEVINAINETVKRNKKVFFTLGTDCPFVVLKDYIYLKLNKKMMLKLIKVIKL